jgi:hypothetical protein
MVTSRGDGDVDGRRDKKSRGARGRHGRPVGKLGPRIPDDGCSGLVYSRVDKVHELVILRGGIFVDTGCKTCLEPREARSEDTEKRDWLTH